MRYLRILDLIVVFSSGQHMGCLLRGTDGCLFDYADGWTLDELHENIREAMFDNLLSRKELTQ